MADLSSGLSPEHDHVALSQPEGQASFGENHAFWLHDEASGVHINGHLNTCEDLGVFEQRVAKLSVAFPDGRLFTYSDTGSWTRASLSGVVGASYAQ